VSYFFEGKTYPTKKAWCDAFPTYSRNHVEFVATGATTVMELEKRIAQARQKTLAAHRKNAQAQNARMVGKRYGSR